MTRTDGPTVRAGAGQRVSGGRRWRLVRARREMIPSASRVRRRLRDLLPRSAGPYWLAVLVAVGIGGLVWLFGFTAVFGVKAVDVTGAPIAGADQIRAVAAVADGTPLARVDTDAVADRVRSVASVASVDVSRSWPSTLTIAVTERVPVAVVARDGVFFVVDREGVVFNQVAQRPEGVVDLTVANPGPDDPTTLAALRVLAALTPELRAQTVAVAADSPYAIRLQLREDRQVLWGDAEHNERKATVATSLLGVDASTIDVSAPDVATTR
jgi:cell division protein FtsQ